MPKGYHKYDDEGYELLCLRLRKSSEGLKQSAAQWDQMLSVFLLKHKFERCIKEPHIWRSPVLSTGDRAVMTIYVDDIYLTCNEDAWVAKFRKSLDELAPHKSLGEISYALGCEIERDDDGTGCTIDCKRKIIELLRRTGKENSSSVSTPIRPGSKLVDDMAGTPITDRSAIKPYQSATGLIIYIMRAARPDLGHAAWYLACGMSSPTVEMQGQLDHTLRFLNGSRDFVLHYTKNVCTPELNLTSTVYTPSDIVGFSDANFEPDKCTGGCFVMILNAAFYWRVKKLSGTQLSTVQAELTTLSELARDVVLLHDVFDFVGIPHEKPTSIFCDNHGAIQNAKHPTYTEKLRHALNRIFYVREVLHDGIVSVRYIPGKLNPADVGTKALGAQPFRLFAWFLINWVLSKPTKAQVKRVANSSYRV
jgi:hypothetical protein